MQPVAVVLAAGASRRMGRDKLRLPWGGTTVLEAALAPYLESGAVERVLLVVRPGFRWPRPLPVELVENPDWEEGMGASLRTGVAASAGAPAWLLGLGDLPGLRASTVRAVARALPRAPRGAVAPSYRGQRGHPVAFDRRWLRALLLLGGDRGARQLLRRLGSRLLELPVDDPGVLRDLDRPEDLPAGGTSPG